VSAKHQLGRFLEGRFRFTEIGSNTASAINRVNLPSLGENKTGICSPTKILGRNPIRLSNNQASCLTGNDQFLVGVNHEGI
jgi:hypothetical protein